MFNETIAILLALAIGYGIGRGRRAWVEERCPKTRDYTLVWGPDVWGHVAEETTTTVRCTLLKGHDGPHRVTLNPGRANERVDWFEDPVNTVSAVELEGGDDQGPAQS